MGIANPRIGSRVALLVGILAGLLVWSAGCGGKEESPEGRVLGTLKVLSPEVVRIREGGSDTLGKDATTELKAGDRIEVGSDGEAMILSGPQVQTLASGAVLQITGGDPRSGEVSGVRLVQGIVTFFFPPAQEERETRFTAVANTVVAAVKGTLFQMAHEGDRVSVAVVRGKVAVGREGEEPRLVGPGRILVTEGSGFSEQELDAAQAKAIEADMMSRRTELGIDVGNF